jgi:predicted DNA-binding antitoxin AbrB/MazE fold protein
MPFTVEAIYENGVLRPTQPLPLKEHDQVRVTLHTPSDIQTAVERVWATAGLIASSDPELIERVALNPIEDL